LERKGVPEGAEQEVAELFDSFDKMVDDLKAGQAEREHRYRDMAALHAIAAAITEPFNLSHLLATTLDRTVEVMNADAGMIYLLNEPAGVLEIAAHQGFSEAYVRGVDRFALGEGEVGRVAVKGEPEIFEDVRTDLRISRDVVRTEGIVSVLIVPVTSKQKTLGTLYVATRSPRSFTPHEVQLLASISHQIGAAVENSRLYEAAQNQAREVAALHEVGATLTTTLDFTAVLESIADSAIKLIGAQRCAVFELDPRDQRLYPRAIRGMTPELFIPLRLGQGAAGSAALLRQPVFSPDVYDKPPPMYDELWEEAGMTLLDVVRQQGYRAILAVPLVSKETVFGAICVYWDCVHPADEREVRLLTALAQQAAVAIENARLHQEIKAARDSLQSIIENSADAIIATDVHGRFSFWSPAAEEMFGYRADEVLGRPIADYYRSGLKEARMIMRRLRVEGKIPNYESAFRAKAGRWVEASASVSLLRDSGGMIVGTLGVVKDITEKKRLEEELVQSERLRVLGEMAAGVAHDFNNLLAIILGNAQLLERRLANPEALERLAIIQKAVEDGVETIRRIQEFARFRSDRPFVTVDMNALVREAIALTRSRWWDEADAAGVTIEVNVKTGEVGPVAGNPAELREVLVNLILNAVDAMPKGGTLTITTGTEPESPSPAAVLVRVADTGIGMSEEVKKRLFEPFFTTKTRRGTGLGLSVAYGIVTRHGGKISVESREGEGSVFTLRLPVGQGAPADVDALLPLEPVGSLRVLVIEDERAVRDILVRFLTFQGHTVEAAPDGPAGIERFTPGAFDLVITDLGMPGMSGWEVARTIKDKDSQVRVIMLTGWGDQLSPELIRSSGVDRVLAKPVAFEELMAVAATLVQPT
jgi:PAS domain S-box-containing protein